MNNKEMFYFAARCLMLDNQPEFKEVIVDKIKNESIDWHDFVELCSDQLILPAIYTMFRKHLLLTEIPGDLSVFLKEIYDLNVKRNEQILNQIQQIEILLNHNNIHPLYLKGAACLIDRLYSDNGDRILGDIDFLVPEKDYLLTVELLKSDGYESFSDELNYYEADVLKHFPPLFKDGQPVVLEVHRLLTRVPLKWFNHLLIEKNKVVANSENAFFIPSNLHLVIHNFVHSQIDNHGYQSGIVSLRNLYDLYLLSGRMSLNEVLPHIKSKRKATAYFALADRLFNQSRSRNLSLYHKRSVCDRYFIFKHDLNKRVAFISEINSAIPFIQEKAGSFLKTFVKLFYSRQMQKSVWRRISNKQWYSYYFTTYYNFFNKKDVKMEEG